MSHIQLYRPRPAYIDLGQSRRRRRRQKRRRGMMFFLRQHQEQQHPFFSSPGEMHGYIQPLSEDGHYHLLPTTHNYLTRPPTVPTAGVFERQCTPRDTNLTRYLYRLVGTVSNSRARGSLRAIRTYIYIYIMQHIHTRYSRYTQQRL